MQLRRRARRVGLGITLLVLLGIVFAGGWTVPLHAQGGDSSGPPPELSILSAEDANDSMLSVAEGDLQKLDSYLARLASGAEGSQLQAVESTLVVEIAFSEGSADAVAAAVAAAGGEVTVTSNTVSLVQAQLPVAALTTIAADAHVNAVRQPTLLYTDSDSSLDAGLLTTEALRVSGAKLWQSAGFTGKGVKIGVIDVDFTGIQSLVNSDDLSSPTYYKDFGDPKIYVSPSGSGLAAAEVVHDMAPNATLYLARVKTVPELENAVVWMLSNGVTILSSSIYAVANGPGDGTGYIPSVIAASRSLGLLWINTAGDNRLATWNGVNLDYDLDSWVNFSGPAEINWINQPLSAGVSIYFAARWSDWSVVNQNLALCVYRWPVGSIFATKEACSNDPQTSLPGQKPVEWVSGTTYGGPAYYGVAIQNYYAVNGAVDLQVFSSHDLSYSTPWRSLVDLADAPAAMTVAAVDVASPYPRTARSSEGPTNGPGGTAKPGYLKPEMVAYSGVSTVTTYPYSYKGSAAAAPHVAGAAALVSQAYNTTDPGAIQRFLQARALKRNSPSPNPQFGYGQLSLGRPPVDYKSFDFDGNQQADILWSNPAAGEAAVDLFSGGSVRTVYPLSPSPAVGEVAVGVGDVTGDGKADVIWYHPGTRLMTIRDPAANEATFSLRLPYPDLRVVGVGDLTGDGIDDIVLRHIVWGYNYLLPMRQGQPTDVIGLERRWYTWRLVGVGDTNGDGTDDLIWHITDEDRYVTDLAPTSVKVDERKMSRPGWSGWSIVGVADFNSDGTDDLVWQNLAYFKGRVLLYFMHDGRTANMKELSYYGDTWRVAAVNDYNGDDKADILWRDQVTSWTVMSLMNGANVIDPLAYFATYSSRWKLVGESRADGYLLQDSPDQGGNPGDPPVGTPPTLLTPDPADPIPNPIVEDSGAPYKNTPAPSDDLTLPNVIDEAAAAAALRDATLGSAQGGNKVYLPLVLR